ncbi:LOW QUALITY PROTEIN: mus81 structure-specific endonuclease subunit [Aphomia sociella]
MNNISGKRITYKRIRPNPLFQDWLEELYEEAREKSKLEPMLKEALDSISKYPLPLRSGAECAILKGFEKKLCIFLDRRLEVYRCNNVQNLENAPDVVQREQSEKRPANHLQVLNDNTQLNNQLQCNEICLNENDVMPRNIDNTNDIVRKTKQMKRSGNKVYTPAYRSGGYAILLGLLENSQENTNKPSLTKELLIEKAQKHSEESFTRPKPETFYTAWSNMTRLLTKGYVLKCKNKKVEYMLTDAGVKLAEELLKNSVDKPTINDMIFNEVISNSDSNKQTEVAEKDKQTVNNATPQDHFNKIVSNKSPVYNRNINNSVFIEMSSGSFDVILLIDKNETGGATKKNDPTVAQFNKYTDLKHEYRSLKVGDFTWIARSKLNKDHELVLPYVIERKRMDDLGASIKDGRFHEQKFRLKKCGLKNVIYMVENYGKNKNVGLPVQTLMQALSNTRVQDGFKVHMTDSLSNSARFLAMMTKRLTIEYKDKDIKGCNSEPTGEELMTFEYFNVSSAKSKPLTVTETFIKLLLQLKGVSVEKALAITSAYSTPALLMKTYRGCDVREGELLLANLKYGDLSRNVGPTVSKSIFQLFSNAFKA